MEYNISLCDDLTNYDAIVLAVSHNEFLQLDYHKLKKDKNAIIFEIKSFLDRSTVDARL